MSDDLVFGLAEVSLHLSNDGRRDMAETVEEAADRIEQLETAEFIGRLPDYVTELEAERDAAFDRIEELEAWKAEASTVTDNLRQAWISAGRPGPPGMSMAQCMAHEIEVLRQAVNDAVTAIADLMVAAEKAREARG